jgi:hypothetical protein
VWYAVFAPKTERHETRDMLFPWRRKAVLINDTLAYLLVGIAGLVSLICFILVLIQMFQRGAVALGVTCIVLTFCCGVGPIIAFVFGWVKARQWNITNLMMVWTVASVIQIVAGVLNPAPYRIVQERIYEVRPGP